MPPLRLVDDDCDIGDWVSDDDDEPAPGERPIPRWLSIISRYDVEVTDPDALFTAALAAMEHHGCQPEDMTEEAVRRDGVGNAVYEIRHGDTPYSDVSDPAPSLRADPDLRRVLPPTGSIEFLEAW